MNAPMTRRELRLQTATVSAPEDGSAPSSGSATASRGRAGRLLGDLLLWIAAAAGVVCIVLVILAYAAGITLIMFKTGSMSPTITAGSVAVVQRIPAADIAVGDVVTVDRAGDLPVTHRVTSVTAGATADERVITMRGDANASDDPFPYTVQSARVVLFAIPGIATVIVAMGSPYVLGGLTLGATALVIWAFWPRSPRGPRAESRVEA